MVVAENKIGPGSHGSRSAFLIRKLCQDSEPPRKAILCPSLALTSLRNQLTIKADEGAIVNSRSSDLFDHAHESSFHDMSLPRADTLNELFPRLPLPSCPSSPPSSTGILALYSLSIDGRLGETGPVGLNRLQSRTHIVGLAHALRL